MFCVACRNIPFYNTAFISKSRFPRKAEEKIGEFNMTMQELKSNPVKSTFECLSVRRLLCLLASCLQKEWILLTCPSFWLASILPFRQQKNCAGAKKRMFFFWLWHSLLASMYLKIRGIIHLTNLLQDLYSLFLNWLDWVTAHILKYTNDKEG